MRVLLINPLISDKKIYSKLVAFSPHLPPLGLCYLASYLEQFNHRITIHDMNVSKHVNLEDLICSIQPDIIGLTSTTISFSSAKIIFSFIKSRFSGIKTLLGGTHISAIPLQTMKECPDIDIGIIGEGEITFGELLEFLPSNKDLEAVKGIIFRRNGELMQTERRPLIDDLDVLPFPARHLLKDFNYYVHHFLRGQGKSISLISSRGCPFNCKFCNQSVFGVSVRAHSASYITKEISKLKRDFKSNFFSFEDDIFNFKNDRVIDLCRTFIENDLNVHWGCSIRVDTIDEETIQNMKKAGCEKVYIGVETFNKRIQTIINKAIDETCLREKIKMIKDYHIQINASFIFGFPTETEKEIKETIKKACSLPVDGAIFFKYIPFHGTALRKLAEQTGIVSNNLEHYSKHASINPYHSNSLAPKALDKLNKKAYYKFYFKLKFILFIIGNSTFYKQALGYLFSVIVSKIKTRKINSA